MDNARCHRKTAREIESRQTDKTDGQTEKKVQDSRTWVEDKHTEGRRREISVDYVSGLILQAQVRKWSKDWWSRRRQAQVMAG